MAVTCQNCGITGHKIKDCRVRICTFCKRKRRVRENCWSKQQETVNRRPVNIEGKVKCYNCTKLGHLARSCPIKVISSLLPVRVNRISLMGLMDSGADVSLI